ncbi:MAG TPA: cyclodeaminase/cyclohydrolase family protein [Patescibacteria group bacterium]|nr:cyclodeaminase/cyclohydrolase family protein [Patescibacteria group bacterium]
MLSSLPVSEFATRLAADDMPPGGGSTAALSGLLATGLLEMAVSYSLKSPKLLETVDFLTGKQAELARLHIELSILIDRDALALRALLAALQLPQLAAVETVTTPSARTVAIQKSLKQAAEVPLETARACLEVMEIAQTVLEKVDLQVVNELMAGVLSAYAGAMSALLGTSINLDELADETLVSALKGQMYLIRSAVDEIKTAMEGKVYAMKPFVAMNM